MRMNEFLDDISSFVEDFRRHSSSQTDYYIFRETLVTLRTSVCPRLRAQVEIANTRVFVVQIIMKTIPAIESTLTARIVPVATGQMGVDLAIHINPLDPLGNISTEGALNTYLLLAVVHGFHNRSHLES